MSENLIPEVLKMLGVTYGEKFNLQAHDPEIYKNYSFFFDKDSELYIVNNLNGSTSNANIMLYSILRGLYTIVKLPWKPKVGDRYYALSLMGGIEPCIERCHWTDSTEDYALLKLGIIYKTEEEAMAHMKADYEELTGKKLEKLRKRVF